jgi:hypothetical protein
MRLSIIAAFAFVALGTPAPSQGLAADRAGPQAHSTCGADHYVNSRGNCVHRPVAADRAPRGASAKCRDGTYSFSQSRRGTCSHHGGVASWL